MSKILKKITKKYKWLRFLNYKATKLAVLSVALFGLCLSSGRSFAKYRDENYGNGNAGTATLGDIYVHQDYETFKLPETMNETNFGTYVIVAEFNIIFSNFEVKASYSFSLEIGGQKSTADNIEAIDHSYFHSNSIENKTKFFAFKNENDGNLVTTDVCSYVTDDKISKFENNKYYYLKGSATMENNDVSTISKTYEENWCVGDGSSISDSVVNISGKTINPNDIMVDCYRVIFFVDMGNDFVLENSLIFYDVVVEQEA